VANRHKGGCQANNTIATPLGLNYNPLPTMELFSIGHSNAEINAFINLLRRYEIAALVDTRSQPYSRYNQHFSREQLKHSLEEAGIEYFYLGAAVLRIIGLIGLKSDYLIFLSHIFLSDFLSAFFCISFFRLICFVYADRSKSDNSSF
jgi:hypothetical protein